MGDIWNFLIVGPFSWLLLTLYNLTRSYGLALILFALVTKLILLYFSMKGKRGMMQQQRLTPKQKELEKQYKNDKQKYNLALQKMYQDEGVSPMSGCLWTLLPFPVLIALYAVVREPLTNLMKLAADQIDRLTEFFGLAESANFYVQLDLAQKIHENFAAVKELLPDAPGLIDINFSFLGINLSQIPKWPWDQGGMTPLLLVPLLSAATAYLMSVISQKLSGNQPQGNMKIMTLLSPAMSLWFGFIMPAAMGVYWIAGNIFSIAQEYFLVQYFNKKFAEEDARKATLEARKKAAEEKIKEENRLRRAAAIEERKNKNKPKVYRMAGQPKKANKPKPQASLGDGKAAKEEEDGQNG